MSKKTAHFACIGAAAVLLFSVFTLCLSPAYANSAGVAWLEAQSCPDDGCYASAGDIGAPFQAAAETLRAFYLLDETAGLADALAYMNAAPPSPRSAKNLSRTLIANVLAGQSAASPAVVELAGALGACVNEDGGVGDLPGYDSTALDTAFALEAAAMTEMNAELAGALQPTLIYLLERQRGDGGWSDSVNDASDVYTAAIAMYALWHYRHYFPENIPPALDKARDFLLGARNAENLWGETFESALALIALSAYVTDLSVLEGSADALRAQQAADGSWESDVYATALCLRALWLYDTQKSDVASRTGHVSGTVLGADSGAAMAGVRVYLDSNPGKTAITDSGGRFLLTGVPAGRHTLLIGKTGYAETGVAIAAGPGSVTDIGEFSLYPVTDANAPAKLTLLGTVIDGISNLPVANAAVLFTAGGDGQTTNIDGDFIFEGIAVRDFQLAIHAAGYASKTYDVSASAFGEAYMTFVLPPANSGPPALVTTLTGAVSDEATGLPAANAEISMADSGQSAMADDVTGRYLLAQIDSLAFTIQVTAPGYASKSYTMEVSQHGTYNLDMELAALPDAAEYRFQIMAIQPLQAETGANANALFSVKAANLAEEAASVLLIGEILDAKGASVANVTPYLPGTEMRAGEFSFAGGEVRELTVPWYTAQMAPGVYRLVLRVTEPGTLSRIVPRGHVLAEESAYVTVTETPAVSGEPAFDPPLLQAGFDTPVTLSALLLNSGNVALASGSYVLRIRDESGTLLHSVQADSPNLEAGRHRMLAFGSWTPSLPGNLRASVTAADAAVRGEIAGVLYVGNKASGTFSADREVMPEGTHTVHGSISMSGVDITAGQSTDPLFFAVREAVRKGGKYTAAEAMQWHHSKRCLGCHIQAQSLMGLASSLDKADTDPEATRFLYDAIAGSQQSDGSLATMARSGYKTTQTSLGLWSLTAWPDKEASFRTMYKAAGYLHDRRRSSGNKTYWHSSYPSYWFSGNIVQTALTVMGFADIVKTARNIDISGVRDYKLVELARLSRGYSVADMEIGADGTLYLLSITNYPPSARVDRFNAETGEITNVATGFSGYSRGFAILPDGTLYVADLRRIIQIRPDGSRESVWSQPSGYIYDVELGPDGFLYLADYYGRLLRVARDGSSMEVLASGGLLSNPTYLAFDAAGSLYAANYAAYNVLKLAPDGAPEIFADELAYMPAGLTAGVDGGLYVAATNRSQYKRGPIYRIDADGAVELLRLPGGSQLGSPAETNGRIFVADNSAGYLHEMVRKELDISSFQVDVEGAVRWFLSNYQESSPDKAVHSMRLAALAEARDAVSDDSLPPQIDEAVNYEAVWLRERQNPDGGWGRYDGQASDPLITAMAGLALDYTDPSSEDPMVRNTIRYLLDTQDAGDGSWENVNNRFKDTRLAATSFVMAYLPKALVRLGGIDVDLHLRLPDSILLGSPGIAPSRESAGTDGSTEYIWHLQGVTSTGRTLEFDLTLSDMLHDEVRATAEAAWLEFDNSFVDQKMRLDLEIPSIRAFSGLSLDTSIDKAIYTNDEAVQITVRTENTAALAIDRLSVELLVEDADGNTAATLAPQTADSLAPGAFQTFNAVWNTGVTLSGEYRVRVRVYTAGEDPVAETLTPFVITAGETAILSLRTATDKAEYHTTDVVVVSHLLRNLSVNTLIDGARLVWRIEGPDGEVKHEQTLDIRQLSPGGQENPLTPYMLEEAAQGAYSVIARVEDADGVLLDSRQASFNVVHDLSVAVTGQVQVETETLDPGVPQICTDIISNRGSPPLSGLAVQRLLINPDTLEVIDTRTDTLDLAPDAEQARQRRLDTGALAAGSYACVLRVKPAEEWQTLAFAGFSVNDIGLCRHDRFDNAPPGPEWSGAAVGDTAAGSFSIADGRLQVSGSGAKGLWRNDDFYYVYREAAGDFRIETEITAIPVNEGGAHRKAGLMLRSGISAAKGRDARLMINLVPNHPADGVSDTEYTALQFAWRKKKDGKNGGRRLADNVPASLPVRVAIEKRGDVYAAYYSEDSGLTWNRPTGGEANGRTSIDMGDTLLAGLGAASYAADTELTAEFDSFSLCALAPPPTPLPRECDAEDRPLDIVYLLDISGSMAERYGESGITKLAAAKEAISVLNLALAERNDGSRAALISFRGYDSAEENRNGSAQVQSGFSDDPGYVSELAQSLEVENETYTATAIGLRRTLEFLQDAHALAHRPMLVWLSDGVPNIDGEGNMDGYSARQVAKVSLYDGQGNFLPHRRVAWSGGWNSALDVYYGKPLADAMIAIEELKGAFPELLIYPVAMTGNGKPGSFSADLLEYAAWQSGASVFGADSADALNAAMLDLFADATCSAPARLADLAASLEGPAQAHTGDTATYTVTVRNHGPFDAEEAVLEASLPAGMILVSITPEQGVCDENAHCVFGGLEKGAAVKAELRLRVHEPGLLLNSVTVSGLQTRDPNPANNSAGMETFVTDPAPPAPSACITDDFDNGGGTWLEASVGSAAGAFSTDNGRMRVSGSGAELWKNDDFYYVYREVADDFRMEADIVDIPMNQGGMHRKAGLMIRAGISAAQGRDARIMVNLAPNHPADSVSDTEYTALQFGLRGGEGKSGGSRFAANVPVELPVRIAIEKNGRTYGVFWSEDGGETWQQPQEGGTVKIDMGERLLAGMGAVSYAADTLMTAEFDNFGICEPPPPPPPAERLCPAPERPLDVLYLLDTSGSMFWDYAGGGTKFAAAKEAMLALNALLAQRADGSRAAVMTFDGYSSPEENLSGAVLLHQEFSADLDAAGGVIAGLRMEDRPSKTATALALQKALALLQGARDPAHQPLLAWFSDGVPTVDALGRNAPYWSEEIESIRLYDSTGGFLSRQEAAWRGMYNRDAGVYAGQALADAMEALERLQSEIEDLLIYPVAIQGDGKTAGTFSEDLLNYAAWRTGTPVFSADNADDLNAAMPALLADSACAGPSPANRAAVRLSNPEAFGGLRKALADKTGLPPAVLKDGRLETAADARGRRYAMRLGKDAEPAPALPLGLVSPAASSSRPAGFVFVYRNEAGEKYRRRVYPASAHPQAVYAAGNESVHLKSDGTLAVTLNGRLYRGVFDYAVTAGPADGRLTLTRRPGELPPAFLVTYPNGDRQKLFMLPPAKTTE